MMERKAVANSEAQELSCSFGDCTSNSKREQEVNGRAEEWKCSLGGSR